MAVTEYKPINTLGCRYSYDKLENVVYLVSEEHVKDIHIDNGEAYITDLTEAPLRLEGYNIQFSEDSSLDERYKFTKQVTFSLHGYVPYQDLNEKFYVILKSKDGTKWMVNVDFPSKVTYTFNLDSTQYETDFTFSSVSNFPTLRLATDIDEGTSPCKELKTFGIEKLRMLETDYCRLERTSGTVHTYGHSFVDVDFLGKSCSLEEQFDGEKVTTTVQFNIAFDAYKSSWHYNLLEFLKNRYSAIIKAKGTERTFFSGFNFGLQPSFSVATTSQNGDSDIITVTLVETSLQGSTSRVSWSEREETETRWTYVRNVGIIQGWECVDVGIARYLLQQEVNQLGEPTGCYKAFEGYTSHFPTLNIFGEFTEEYRFGNSDCTEQICNVNTSIPTTITYNSATCYTYNYSASCDWQVTTHENYISVSPSSGNGGNNYTLTVCNSKTPTTNESSTFNITAGNNTRVVNVNLTTDASILNPSSVDINCLPQNVTFNFNPSCRITVTNIDPRLTYNITNSQLIVSVPSNTSTTNTMVWNIKVKDCNNKTQTVTINQDKTYERWVNTSDYMCDGTTSYVKQQRYTGTTSSNINTPTSEYRSGAKIQDYDSRCGGYSTRWVTSSTYTCIDGNKWSIEEQEISYDGTNWTKNGVTKLGTMVESASSFCEETVEYKWVLTDKWQCYGGEVPFNGKFKANYNNGTSYELPCDGNSILSSGETRPTGYETSDMTSAVIGDCVTSIGKWGFSFRYNLTSVTIPESLTSIGESVFINCLSLRNISLPNSIISIDKEAFGHCTSLTSIVIPSGVTSISNNTFYDCSGLTSVTIPTGVTSIGKNAFWMCSSLVSLGSIGSGASVEIPNSVTSIDDDAFHNCYSLGSVDIPSGVTFIGDNVFAQCRSLTSITVDNNNNTYDSRNNCNALIETNTNKLIKGCDNTVIPNGVTSIGHDALFGCSGLTSITLPNSVTSIGDWSFAYCSGMTSCTIGTGVTSIGNYTFPQCNSLNSITIHATTPPVIGDGTFGYTNNCPIYVPAASVNTYKSASGWSSYASRIQAIP